MNFKKIQRKRKETSIEKKEVQLTIGKMKLEWIKN